MSSDYALYSLRLVLQRLNEMRCETEFKRILDEAKNVPGVDEKAIIDKGKSLDRWNVTERLPTTVDVLSESTPGSCNNGYWRYGFVRTGWSKCPSTFPYINGLYRSKTSDENQDKIYNLEGVSCCEDFENINSECKGINWWDSFNRQNHWNLCTPGYYLSGLYRTGGNNLHNIEAAWCCKPNEAPNSYTSCYDEDVSLKFNWDKEGMVSCTTAGFYITGLYRSECDILHCIDTFKCCKL
ncbi:Hypothetical predicted protein [Paramuricea clavata]|uniref:Uncharacterized protein n=1 Tax=Paramuricea clavata TaxID=317549 RepID=A0A6S7H8Y9_PARCT|nr:Hypothetical predicted protein [Paramuricea clavata]